MSKKVEDIKGWPADEEHWRQWLPNNYGKLKVIVFTGLNPIGAEMDQRSVKLKRRWFLTGAEIG